MDVYPYFEEIIFVLSIGPGVLVLGPRREE